MPSFLKDLSIRRKSRTSVHPSASDSSGSVNGEQRAAHKSTSTLNSYLDKTSPPTTLSSHRSNNNLSAKNATARSSNNGSLPPPIPGQETRPHMPSSQSNRYSITGMPLHNGDRPTPATSPLAPRVLSVSDNSWVHQKVLLIFGQCADAAQPIDGHIAVCHHQDNFPPTTWPVCGSHFKALVYLQPGPNRLRLDFTSPKLPAPRSAHSSWININYLPLNSSPPLQLCILVAKDSPQTFDAVPERAQKEGNSLATAIRKLRMAAYLWQAFTAEQMNRNGFGRRCYRYEEEWQPGTLTWKDMESGQMRNEAKIHVITMDNTVQEIQDLDIAQQYEPAKNKGGLYDMAMDAVRSYFRPRVDQPQYVSCMFLDSHWDSSVGTIRGHAALGGGTEDLKLAIFGSHCLQSYPSHLEEVVPALTDCTRTNTDFVANDCNEAGSSWEAANIGIGAHLHETGHLLGCPHQEDGVMMRDYTRLNRTFTCREPYATRTKQHGPQLCLPKDECGWHRLDTLRFRFHPTFQLPNDPSVTNADKAVQVWGVEDHKVLVTAPNGIAWIEITPEHDDVCHHWIEYLDQSNSPVGGPRQIMLTEQIVRDQLPAEKRKQRIDVKIFGGGGGDVEVKDFMQMCSSSSKVKLPDGRPGFKSQRLGSSEMEGTQPEELLLGNCHKKSHGQGKLLLCVRVYHDHSVHGIEFFYEDGISDLFGKRKDDGGYSDFTLDTRKGEMLLGFHVRAGWWIDGIQILTNTGRKSDLFGKADGGTGYTLIPPRGYSLAGIFGSCGPWLDGFGLIITR